MRPYRTPISNLYGTDRFFDALEKELPPVFTRDVASRCMGGLLSPKSMSNADAMGIGPSVRVRIGKKVAYERASFMTWLRQRLEGK